MNTPLIALEQIGFSVGKSKPKVILNNINLEIYPNTITTIVGPNGGGKSTVLKILLGLQKPTSGKVRNYMKRGKIGYLPQKLNCDRSLPLSVKQLLKNSPNQENYDWLVENLDLEAILDTSIHAISGGERQRAFLARALMNSPQLLVLDEPTQGTDINRQAYLYRLITQIRDKFHCAVLLVSHDLLIVMKNTDRVICLDKHIHCEGQPVNVVAHPEFSNIFGHIIAKNLQEEFAFYPHNLMECKTCHEDEVEFFHSVGMDIECEEGCTCSHASKKSQSQESTSPQSQAESTDSSASTSAPNTQGGK